MGKKNHSRDIDGLSLAFTEYYDGDVVGALEIQKKIEALIEDVKQPLELRALLTLYMIMDYLFQGNPLDPMMPAVSQIIEMLQFMDQDQALPAMEQDLEKICQDMSEFHDDFCDKFKMFQEQRSYLLKDPKEENLISPVKKEEVPLQEQDNSDSEDPLAKDRQKFIQSLSELKNNEIFQIFLTDTKERLLSIEELVLHLEGEADPDPEDLNHLFRIFHTIKGEAGFFSAKEIMHFAHEIENKLDKLRSSRSMLTREMSDELFTARDLIERYLVLIHNEDLQGLEEFRFTAEYAQSLLGEASANDTAEPDASTPETALQNQELEDASKDHPRESQKKDLSTKDEFIRVRASQIAELNDRIQELWITENQLEGDFLRDLKKITKEIQYLAMKLRTGSLRKLEPRLQRIVRDVSGKTGKKAQLSFTGEDIEIDRNLIESLEEPLLHIIRNSVDHGLETPKERSNAQKDPQGNIWVSSTRKGSRIQIAITDDGRGLNHEKILARAMERQLITEESVENMDDSDIAQLIFEPGFSTAETVSDLSGRGVGMDVVRTMVSQNNGRLQVESKAGEGTTIRFSFPLNTAILEGMIVRYDEHHFVVPLNEVVECIEVTPDIVQKVKNKLPVIKLRESFIPVLRIGNLFSQGEEKDMRRSAVIMSSNNKKYALLVDRIVEKAEVAVKPLGKQFQHIKGLSSATIFSGGKIGYVIDTEELIYASVHHKKEGKL